jgi:hypothetical protein
MARVAPAIPEESALLCEKCGYIVNGIPMDSLCPECAAPIVESLPQRRQPSLWESAQQTSFISFWRTTAQLIFTPAKFFRALTPHGDMQRTAIFARWHLVIACMLFGSAAFIHAGWAWGMFQGKSDELDIFFDVLFILVFSLAAYAMLAITTALAARLTAWEAAYRGLRLPRTVVQRALHFHSAHYLPVALLTFLTIGGHQVLIHKTNIDQFAVPYLYVLCAEVILAAGYLFSTYWKGMRNLMYANG